MRAAAAALGNAALLVPIGGGRLVVAEAGEDAVDLGQGSSSVLRAALRHQPADQRSPYLRLACADFPTPPCFRLPPFLPPARASFGLALLEAALLPPCSARPAGGRGGSLAKCGMSFQDEI